MSDQAPASPMPELQTSQVQRSNAALLEQLVKSEGENPPPIPRPPTTHKSSLRMVIAAVLILAIGLSLFPGLITWQAGLPAIDNEVLALYQFVQGLSTDAPVLVAVDYQPAFTGEMEMAAGPVLEHLAVQGAYLVLVSTVPSGPVQADRLIDEVNKRSDNRYLTPDDYANLGYIPGGATGLRSFAEAPRASFPEPLSDTQEWQSSQLQNVDDLSDFRQVVVITDNPDTARAWLEQTRSWLGGPPLLMVLSAQAAPLVRPYFDAVPQRVQGLLSGMAGGAAYESLVNRTWDARSSWSAFNIGLLAAIALILFGGVYSAVQARQAGPGKRPDGEVQE
jgi:hypothetical protein